MSLLSPHQLNHEYEPVDHHIRTRKDKYLGGPERYCLETSASNQESVIRDSGYLGITPYS